MTGGLGFHGKEKERAVMGGLGFHGKEKERAVWGFTVRQKSGR